MGFDTRTCTTTLLQTTRAIGEYYFWYDQLARLYVQNIVCLHGGLSAIILDKDSHFTLRFWQSLQKEMGTELNTAAVRANLGDCAGSNSGHFLGHGPYMA